MFWQSAAREVVEQIIGTLAARMISTPTVETIRRVASELTRKTAAVTVGPANILDEHRGHTDPVPPRPIPTPWRAALPGWSIPWRQRWGDLANELARSDVPWPDDERQAYARVLDEREAEAVAVAPARSPTAEATRATEHQTSFMLAETPATATGGPA